MVEFSSLKSSSLTMHGSELFLRNRIARDFPFADYHAQQMFANFLNFTKLLAKEVTSQRCPGRCFCQFVLRQF